MLLQVFVSKDARWWRRHPRPPGVSIKSPEQLQYGRLEVGVSLHSFCATLSLTVIGNPLLSCHAAVLYWWAAPLCSSLCSCLDSTLLSSRCTGCRRTRKTHSTGTASCVWTNNPTSRCWASWESKSECARRRVCSSWSVNLIHDPLLWCRKFWPLWMSILGEKKQVRPVTRQWLRQSRLRLF